MTRLDRYLIGKYWGTYVLFLALIMSLAVVFDEGDLPPRWLQMAMP